MTIAGLAAVGVVAIVAVFFLRGPVREWWHISRLSSPDDAERIDATERLLEMASVSAIPSIMKNLDRDIRSHLNRSARSFFETMSAGIARLEPMEQSLAALEKKWDFRMGLHPDQRRDLESRIYGLKSELAARYESTVNHWFRRLLSYRTANRIMRETYPSVRPRLFEWLESTDWQTRWMTVHLVIDLRLRDAAGALQALTADENELVRHSARSGLWVFEQMNDRERRLAGQATSGTRRQGFGRRRE